MWIRRSHISASSEDDLTESAKLCASLEDIKPQWTPAVAVLSVDDPQEQAEEECSGSESNYKNSYFCLFIYLRFCSRQYGAVY